MLDILPNLVSGLFGLAVGALAIGGMWVRERGTQRQKIMDFLMTKRQALDDQPGLLASVAVLQRERAAKLKPLQIWDDNTYDPERMRELPGFLEAIGTYLEYNPATFNSAYGYFSEEVMLCAESEVLWKGDIPFRESPYWRSFTRFVDATTDKGFCRK